MEQEYFKAIKEDQEIQLLYEEIHQREEEQDGLACHDFTHVMNVANCCEKLLQALNYEQTFIDEVKIAALLHDTGCKEGKENHPYRSYCYAKEYLKRKNIILKDENLILEAIKGHSNGFDTDNIIQIVLVLADKLDIKKDRLTERGKKEKGIRQYQYINDIKIKIEKDKLNIFFLCDDNIAIKELNDYYFTKKVFLAVKAFARKMKFIPNLYINQKRWDAFYRE